MGVRDLFDIKEHFQRLAKGEPGSFKIIFESYRKRVFGVALKALKSESDAEEVVQDVFLAVWQARENLFHVNDPEGYLFTITYNTIYAHLRKISRDRQLLNTLINYFPGKQNTTRDLVDAHEVDRLINRAIDQLPAQQRTVYELNRREGLSYDEIADRLNLSRNTVRNHLAEAMKRIRSFLIRTTAMLIIFF